MLSAYSADLGISSTKGNTPLHFAAAGGFNECCRFLAQRGRLGLMSEFNVFPLFPKTSTDLIR